MSRTKPRDRHLRDAVTVRCPCGKRLAEVKPSYNTLGKTWDGWVYATRLLPLDAPGGVEYVQAPQPVGRIRSFVDPERWRCPARHCHMVHEIDGQALHRQLVAAGGAPPEVTLGDDPPPPPLPPLRTSRDW
jgi:hypothetical protein